MTTDLRFYPEYEGQGLPGLSHVLAETEGRK